MTAASRVTNSASNGVHTAVSAISSTFLRRHKPVASDNMSATSWASDSTSTMSGSSSSSGDSKSTTSSSADAKKRRKQPRESHMAVFVC
ncbi:hypothetical protein PLICRDRAFT_179446 [Plicaturopsis crispa FD-325 SS-3]|uniref:Uncharacterized protein n=1 Tax=Plicaturopsis crispa FD-325 SS-3 TaxID=944288 RepID=A0A0C9SRG3_PLICR|nr:hypothetical protein PLICRDRAFT_179446 [Plicaturopsis crispa FD-325 SS-3]